MENCISIELLNELFKIIDNKLIWAVNRGTRKLIGKEAGKVNTTGYLQTGISGKYYVNHRLMYMMYNNTYIEDGLQIDHIDGNRLNNSKENLRIVTPQENHFNRTKAKGITFCKANGKWKAQIFVSGKKKYLGYYEDEKDARDAYIKAKYTYHKIEERC